MASNYIRVNTGALRNDANELAEMAEQARRQLKDMYDHIIALDRMWDGPANETFVQQYTGDYELLNSICDSVKAFSNDLKDAAQEYDKCEDSVENAVRAIRV